MNLQEQVELLLLAALQASSEQRHAQHAASQLTWVKHRLKRASDNHHEQSRSYRMLACDHGWVSHASRAAACVFSLFFSDLREDVVDEPLQPHGTFVELAVGFRLGGAGAEVLVGDVERD